MKKLIDIIKNNKIKSILFIILSIICTFIFSIFLLFSYNLYISNKEYQAREDNIEFYNNLDIKDSVKKDTVTKDKNKEHTPSITKEEPKEHKKVASNVSEKTNNNILEQEKPFLKKFEQKLVDSEDIAYLDEADEIEKVGQLKIEKINLNLPIFKGLYQKDGEDSMMYGAITNKVGQEMGERNYILSSHKAFEGQLFSKLYTLEKGDLVEISNNENTYIYRVFDNFEIKEDEGWIFKDLKDKERSILTLYTCLTTEVTEIRTVIRAELVEIRPN